jgi:hypothetical protein
MLSNLFKFAGVLVFACIFVGVVTAAPQRLKWRKNTIEIAVSASLLENNQTLPPKDATLTALMRAFQAWEGVTNVRFRSTISTLQNVDPPGPHGDGVSLITNSPTYENQSLFPKGLDDAAARTRVFYDGNGVITEADIVLNPFLQFSVDGNIGTFDLQATLTHELGHLLGLDHSDILGSTMGENSARNGLLNPLGFSPRTLSLSDVASVRALYGSPSDQTDCCARVGGKLTLKGGKGAADWLVWIEDAESGRVIASVRTSADGSFTVGGVEIGQVKIFAEPRMPAAKFGFESIGEFSLERGSIQRVDYQIKGQNPEFSLSYMGFGDQFAKSAVALNAGYVYTVFVAGHGLDPETLSVSTSSPSIQINKATVPSIGFGSEMSSLSFQVEISKEAQDGDYSIFVTNSSGSGIALVGSLTVEKYPNLTWTRVSLN